MKKTTFILLSIALIQIATYDGYSQATLRITDAYQMAVDQSPLQKQKLYIESTAQLNSRTYKTINYPQLMLNGQASYQSDVFSLPFQIPGADGPIIPQEQYKVGIDFYQNIYDGGLSKSATQIENAKMKTDMQSLEVSFYQIKEVINSIYFGILKTQKQKELIENTQKDLNSQKSILEASVNQGAALPVSVKMIEKEIISLDQKLIELESSRIALIDMLGKWINMPLTNDVILELPDTEVSPEILEIVRPESKHFELQSELLESRKSQLTAQRIPDIGIFGTAGIGNPNPLNFFEVEPSGYWLAGIKLSWKILDYGKTSRDKEVLALQQQSILSARENFEKAIDINMSKYLSDITKYQQLIEKDRGIVKIQEEIVAVSSSQLQNGIINSNDYIMEVNKGLNANISLSVHEIELEMAKVELITITGNIDKI